MQSEAKYRKKESGTYYEGVVVTDGVSPPLGQNIYLYQKAVHYILTSIADIE